MRFVLLTEAGVGRAVLVNPAHVAAVRSRPSMDRSEYSEIQLANGNTLDVRESLPRLVGLWAVKEPTRPRPDSCPECGSPNITVHIDGQAYCLVCPWGTPAAP